MTDCATNSLEGDIEVGVTSDNELRLLKGSLRMGDQSRSMKSDHFDQLSGPESENVADDIGTNGNNDRCSHHVELVSVLFKFPFFSIKKK